MSLFGTLSVSTLWGYGKVPEFLKLMRFSDRWPPGDPEDAVRHVTLKVKPVDDPFVEAGNLSVPMTRDEWTRFLLGVDGQDALRVVAVRSGPDMRLSGIVKWEVEARPTTVADRMEMLMVLDGLDDSEGVR